MLCTLLRVFSIYFIGTSVAFFLVAKCVYAPMKRDETDEDEPIPFEWRFLEELDMLTERELSADELLQLGECEVDVETPDGRVLMSYDEDSKSFAYYTDSKNISFRFLDAVARQFAIENDAKQVCVNYGRDYVVEGTKPSPSPERSSLFVKLKQRQKEVARRIKVTNRFSHRGSIDQKWVKLDQPSSMTFADYKKKCVDNA